MPYIGDLFIYTATAAILASIATYFLAWRGREELLGLARKFFNIGTVLIAGAFFILLYLILTHDFGVVYVFQYSSTDLPLYFLISTLWGGQEGTFLMWILFAGVMGIVMMKTAGKFEKGNMFFLGLFILSILVILLKKSPFEMMPVFRIEGNGLNPLLQNFWMTIHPPIMFVGFAAATFPFCFAMTGLINRQYDTWAEASRRWTIFAWSSLGIGLVMGGYWAYETLGWGGFWAWDPVENASLIPWIFLTAQIHTLYVKRQRRGLMRFSLVMVSLSFWSVLYGTFLTRSGVLADFSVHSFVDLGINQYLIAGLVVFVITGIYLIAMRWKDIKPNPSFSTVNSRTYLAALGIVVLFVGGLLVLLGTSAPLLTRVTGNPSAVDMSYYFTTMTPVAVVILLLIALFPAFRWNEGLGRPGLLIIGGAALVVTVGLLLALGVTTDIIYLLLFGAGGAALATNGFVLVRSLGGGRFQAGYLSHVGLAIALIGAAASSGFETKRQIVLPRNEVVNAMGMDLTFTHMTDTPLGFDCHVNVEGDGASFVGILPHEFPKNSEGVMKKPFIKSYLLHDLYLSPIAIEQPETVEPGVLYLQKGQTQTLDKYEFTFDDFETGGHGDEGADMTAAALVQVVHDGRTEKVKPVLRVVGESIQPVKAEFDEGRASMTIAGVRPEDSGVMIKIEGDFLPPAEVQEAALVLELSRKPLIMFFWLGTLTVFISGMISVLQRQRKRTTGRVESVAPGSFSENRSETVSGNPAQ